MGWVEASSVLFVGDDLWNVTKRARSECLIEAGMTEELLAQAITDTYRAEPEIWTIRPGNILEYVEQRLCWSRINRARALVGITQQMLPPAELLESLKRQARSR